MSFGPGPHMSTPWLRLPALVLAVLAVLAVTWSDTARAQSAAPTVTDVRVSSTPASNDTYALGETITIRVTFNEAVDVTGTPQLTIDMDPAGWGEKAVDYAGGSGTASLTFEHEVVQPNYSTRGIAVLANSLALNGGAIRSASSQADADLSHTGRDHDAGHRVDWRLSPSAPEAPGKPSELRAATEEGSLDVELDWDDVDGAVRYHVRWRAAGPGNELNAGVVTTTSQLDISVTGHGQWVARVQACNDAGCGKPQTKKFRVEPAPEPRTEASPEPTPEPTPEPAPALDVSISASPAGPEVNQYATLSATIANIPFDSGAPSYDWQVQRDGGWNSVWSGPTFSYSSNAPTAIAFRLTLSYASGISDTSEPLTVTWTGDPPPVVVAPEPEPVIKTLEVAPAAADCELAPPERVSALGVERAAVAFWQAPSGDDACEPTGYLFEARSVNGGDWRSEFVRAEARSHVLDDLTPGQVEYHVTTIYPTGASDRPLALPQVAVPEACNLELTVEANIDRGISGTWSNRASMPAGCAVSLEIEYEYKESTWDHFRNYGRFNNHQRVNPNQPSFIAYGLKPDVTYDFRIVAVDAAGRKNESNVASATVRYDADATADANSPTNLRVQPDNNSGALVTWSAPASLAAGRTLSGYVVQWLSGGVNSTTVAADTTSHRITGLTDGTVYRVRVAARTSGTNPTSHDAWTVFSTPFTAWSEPTQVWFTDQTPHIVFGRVVIETASNKRWATITCSVQMTAAPTLVACPVGSRVSHAPTGGITTRLAVAATAVIGVESTSVSVSGNPGGPSGLEAAASAGANASDSDATTHEGTIAIAWTAASTTGVTGTLRYYVGRRSGTSGSFGNWVPITGSDRSHTYEGLADGTYQVSVLGTAVTIGDHDGDPMTPHQDIETDGFSAGLHTVIVSAANTAAPGRVTGGTVTPGPGSLIAEWEPPEGKVSAAHAYQVRHRDYLASGHRSDDVGWTEGPVLLPRQTLRICDPTGCENPRSHEITGLIGGNRYDVAVRAQNANGWGAWHYIGIRNVADGFTPVLQSAAVNAASLTLTFDRTIDTGSKPDKSAFTVTVAGTDQTPTAVGISGSTVTLTLGTAVTKGQTVTVSYARPDENPLQHEDAPAQGFTNQSVTNNTP